MSTKQIGKSSIFGILFRMYLFFLLIGSPFLWWFDATFAPKVGQWIEDRTVMVLRPATEEDVTRFHAIIIGSYLAGVTIVIGASWIGTTVIWSFMAADDAEYQAWRAQGGDPYFDNMSGPFNMDDERVRELF